MKKNKSKINEKNHKFVKYVTLFKRNIFLQQKKTYFFKISQKDNLKNFLYFIKKKKKYIKLKEKKCFEMKKEKQIKRKVTINQLM